MTYAEVSASSLTLGRRIDDNLARTPDLSLFTSIRRVSCVERIKIMKESSESLFRLAYKTKLGRAYIGDSRQIFEAPKLARALEGKVQLVVTSPPFVLNKKKKYGNLQGDEYIEWLTSYAPILRRCLTDTGSIVVELGNAWEPGQPTMSTVAIEALLAFKRAANLYLCQEFVCFNPARLPSPAQWVTIERTRVKDAFTRVWWLSPTPNPKADNRRVLTAYSEGMRALLRRGTYNAGIRPSEHRIGKRSFLEDHGGAIPPNVLVPGVDDILHELERSLSFASTLLPISNTGSSDPYQRRCREAGLDPHPARMPLRLAEFFVKFLTDPGDLVFDPFGGSNTSGFVSERLGRRWAITEISERYAHASAFRFVDDRANKNLEVAAEISAMFDTAQGR